MREVKWNAYAVNSRRASKRKLLGPIFLPVLGFAVLIAGITHIVQNHYLHLGYVPCHSGEGNSVELLLMKRPPDYWKFVRTENALLSGILAAIPFSIFYWMGSSLYLGYKYRDPEGSRVSPLVTFLTVWMVIAGLAGLGLTVSAISETVTPQNFALDEAKHVLLVNGKNRTDLCNVQSVYAEEFHDKGVHYDVLAKVKQGKDIKLVTLTKNGNTQSLVGYLNEILKASGCQ